jgi:hypothetical protein
MGGFLCVEGASQLLGLRAGENSAAIFFQQKK